MDEKSRRGGFLKENLSAVAREKGDDGLGENKAQQRVPGPCMTMACIK